MKKMISFFVAVLLAFVWSPVSFEKAHADVDITGGQSRASAPVKFFVARNARRTCHGGGNCNNGNVISADSVVTWDGVSNDGITVMRTGTSFDALVVGVTMDSIPGSSRDFNATSDQNYTNWGRVQCWGRRAAVRWASHLHPNGEAVVSGARVATSAVPGSAGLFFEASSDNTQATSVSSTNTSRDYFGVTLEGAEAAETLMDIFIDRC